MTRDAATGELKRTPSWHSFGSLGTGDSEGEEVEEAVLVGRLPVHTPFPQKLACERGGRARRRSLSPASSRCPPLAPAAAAGPVLPTLAVVLPRLAQSGAAAAAPGPPVKVRRLSTGTEVIYTRVVHAPVEPVGQDPAAASISSWSSEPGSATADELAAIGALA